MIIKKQTLTKETYNTKCRYVLEEKLSYKGNYDDNYFIDRINKLIKYINYNIKSDIWEEDIKDIENIEQLVYLLKHKFNNKESVLNLYTKGSGDFTAFEYKNNDIKILVSNLEGIKLYIDIKTNNRHRGHISKVITRLHCPIEYIKNKSVINLFDSINIEEL